MNAKGLLVGVVGVALGLIGWAAYKRGGEVLAGAAQKLNPLSDQNLAYQGANAAVSAAAGREETLGGWLRSITSNDDAKVEAMLTGKPAPAPMRDLMQTDAGEQYDAMGNRIF